MEKGSGLAEEQNHTIHSVPGQCTVLERCSPKLKHHVGEERAVKEEEEEDPPPPKTRSENIIIIIIIIIIIMMMMMIIIIAFKGAIRDFFFNNLLTAPRTVSNTYAQVARAQSCANHVLHIERLSRATCVTSHLIRRDSSAIKFDRVEIAFI